MYGNKFPKGFYSQPSKIEQVIACNVNSAILCDNRHVDKIIQKTLNTDIQTMLLERQEKLEFDITQAYKTYFKFCTTDLKITSFYVKCPCELGCNFYRHSKSTISIGFCYYLEELLFFLQLTK